MFGNVSVERKALEATYEGIAEIITYEDYTVESGATRKKEVVSEPVPCALSRKSGRTAIQGDDRATVEYDAKLFMAPEHEVKAGSKIKVTQNGMNYTFKCVGESFKYATHQELILKRGTDA